MIKRFQCFHLGSLGQTFWPTWNLLELQGTRPQPLGSSETDHVCGVDRDVLGALATLVFEWRSHQFYCKADISTMGDMEAGYGNSFLSWFANSAWFLETFQIVEKNTWIEMPSTNPRKWGMAWEGAIRICLTCYCHCQVSSIWEETHD